MYSTGRYRGKLISLCERAFIRKFGGNLAAVETASPSSAESKPFRTNLPVTELSAKNEGQWFTIPKEAFDTLSFNIGLYKPFRREMETLREYVFIARRPALDVINCLNGTGPDNPALRYIFYGRHGCGKTVSLHHVVHWAQAQKWIVCFFPSAFTFRRGANTAIQSTWKVNRMDLPEEASLWLTQFKRANFALLDNPKLVTTSSYNWAPNQTTESGTSLLNMIDQGVNSMKISSDCMAVLLKELKHYARIKEIKLLLAVDSLNSFFGTTMIRRSDNYYAEPDDVTIMRAVRDMLNSDWNNGAVVATVDMFEKYKNKELLKAPPTAHLPYYLLGREGFNMLEPFVPVQVPNYTNEEADNCVDYYIDKRWLANPHCHTADGKAEMFRLTCRNPLLMMLTCGQY